VPSATIEIPAGEIDGSPTPQSSWFDALLRVADRVPLGPGLFYPSFAALVLLLLHVQAWLSGAVAVGTFDPTQATHGFYIVYPLALLDYLHRAAARAWREFRPAADVSDDVARRLGYELTHIPTRAGAGVAVLGAVVVAVSASSPASGMPGLTGIPLVIGAIAIWVAVTTVLLLVVDIVRMLRFVGRVLERDTRVNLFKPEPLYAFSRLTLRAALGLIAIATFQLLVVPAEINAAPETIAWLGMILIAGTAAFILPLSGIHDRIVAEKRILEAAVGDRIEATIARIHAAVDADAAAEDDHLSKRLASLIQEREFLARLPTWPWETGTARTFASAILLPVLIWLLTRLLGRLV
jgi:hypothetical protein